jgi:hypothetical protein
MSMQKRSFFRLNLGLRVFIKFINFDSGENRFFLDKTWTIVKTKDISASGVFVFSSLVKKSVAKGDKILLKFKIPKFKENIYLIGNVVRVEEKGFALHYVIIDDMSKDKLINAFLKIGYEKDIAKDS